MPKTHNVHVHDFDLFDLYDIADKAFDKGIEFRPVSDDQWSDMLLQAHDVGPRIRKFKFNIPSGTGTNHKAIYTKEWGFHHLLKTGEVVVLYPKSFVAAVIEARGVKAVEHECPGIQQYLVNFPSKEEFAAIVAQNSTGNHYRNKHITVAVQPGQPVRG